VSSIKDCGIGRMTDPVVKWSVFLATDPEVRVPLPVLLDFLSSSGSGPVYKT
jgi:hypothetical protein